MNICRGVPLLAGIVLSAISPAQWSDVQQLENGGESTVVSDGNGHIYVTSHMPSKLLVSNDWGKSFRVAQTFKDNAGGDMLVMARPNGRVNVAYLAGGGTEGTFLGGVANWYSSDYAKTLTRGVGPKGPLDREWMITAPSGKVFMIYSNGFIGGPKSKGIFLTSSADGKTFEGAVRVDKTPTGSYAVDPFLTQSSDGRIYALWEVTSDYNTIDSIAFAYSMDGGKSFTGHRTVAVFPKDLEGKKLDNQERWILASIAASGQKSVLVTYPGYENITVDGQKQFCFVQHYSYSDDGGKTFSRGETLLSRDELQDAIASFTHHRNAEENFPYYIEVLPWSFAEPKGGFHVAFTDNRLGQGEINGHQYGKWQVRVAHAKLRSPFSASEQVSAPYVAKRPPMDFISGVADARNLYITWTDAEGSLSDFPFTGKLFFAKRANH